MFSSTVTRSSCKKLCCIFTSCLWLLYCWSSLQ